MDNHEFIALAREFGKGHGIDCSVALTRPVEGGLFYLFASHPKNVNSAITFLGGNDFLVYHPDKIDELHSSKKYFELRGYHTYILECVASASGGVNSDLFTASPAQVIRTLFHEGWHQELYNYDKMNRVWPIEEPCCDVVGYTAAERFFLKLDYKELATQVRADRTEHRKIAQAFRRRYFERVDFLNNGGRISPDDEYNNGLLLAQKRYYLHFPLVDDAATKMGDLDEITSRLRSLPPSRKAAVHALEHIVGKRVVAAGKYERVPVLGSI